MKIIGLEFRLINPSSGRQTEIAVFPLELVYPSEGGRSPQFNLTVHTTEGDVTLDSRNQGGISLPLSPIDVPYGEFDRKLRELIARSR